MGPYFYALFPKVFNFNATRKEALTWHVSVKLILSYVLIHFDSHARMLVFTPGNVSLTHTVSLLQTEYEEYPIEYQDKTSLLS